MNKQNPHTESLKGKIDWSTAVIPFVLIAFLCISFMAAPDGSRQILDKIRVLLGDTFGLYYLVIGLGVFLLSIYLAFSRYGSIRLGGPNEKPKYSDFAWSSMMFTAGLAADILFYSFCEWILYANDPHIAEMGSADLVQHLSHLPLGPHPLELLSGAGRSLRLHAPCTGLPQAEIF